MARLDKSRPYSQVYGIADHAFGQDGRKFDKDGEEVGAPEVDKPEPVKAKPVKAAKAEPDQVDAQLNG